ncbi:MULTISPECIES: YopJ/AvrA family T3SS effector serine/threonine acetyltransferase [unclassified Chromobacterium]|uniref:YopJ/AvrA family T3SS effector serine/threonine acetyltransferase n=1 Tax=unclassified Chromobacterium TaxID=2641838 RepID=UPI001F37A5FC|nr:MULTISPECIES: YopJ/AvrA family T3SS effector serine/threonine acetyltransferase [unclassified Chromobacterium]MCP1290293.1 YopJ/AvrA family T3SS effector serine/threonine acetyltransferase [Chromobacterium sp. S0633]UJB30800.1 Effector protein YopJ [Chromobacterium sp. Beijing]
MPGSISSATHSSHFDRSDSYRTDLGRYIRDVEKSLDSGAWTTSSFAKLDKEFIPGLIASANTSKPGLNLTYASDARDLSDKILEIFHKGSESGRYIVNMGSDGIHFAVFDYRLVEGKPSVLMFEPANFNSTGPMFLAFRAKSALDQLSSHNICFSMMEMDIQRSGSECAIFSLALAKKLFKEHQAVSELHQMNASGAIPSSNGFFSSSVESDQLIPPSFYKHTQGRGRLEKYVTARPGREAQEINKKGETLLERQKQHLENIGGKELVNSIHQKRLEELKQLMQSISG